MKRDQRRRIEQASKRGYGPVPKHVGRDLFRHYAIPGYPDIVRDEGPQRRARRPIFVPLVCSQIVQAWLNAKSGTPGSEPKMALISYDTMLKLVNEAWEPFRPPSVFRQPSVKNFQNFTRDSAAQLRIVFEKFK